MRDAELRIPHPASRKVRDAGCGLRNRRKLPFSASIDNDSVIIEGYMDPSLEGAVLSFDCPPQHVDLIPRRVWGMENGNQTQGKWNAKVLCYAKYSRVQIHMYMYMHVKSTLIWLWQCH